MITDDLRETDAGLAEHVMGVERIKRKGVVFNPPRYTTDLVAANELLAKMVADGWNWMFLGGSDGVAGYFRRGRKGVGLPVKADTLPLALCLAAKAATQ